MNDILNKISSYNLLNYLLPGAVFSVVAELFGLIPAPTEIVEKLIWFYFVGMVISRLGSLILEPLLKKMAFVKYSDYADYLKAYQVDGKLEVMVEASNTYRTLASAFAALVLCFCWTSLASYFAISTNVQGGLTVLLLFILFVVSFRKQASFITKRVERIKDEQVDNN